MCVCQIRNNDGARLNVSVHYVKVRVFILFSYVFLVVAHMNVTVMPLALFPFYFETN